MSAGMFSSMALDAIGEIFNISLGSSATAVSNMLARRVDITTPTVSQVIAEEFTLGDLQPAIGVKIDYIAGLTGSNIMLLKRSDVRAIADILLGTETKDADFEINDLNKSAICEVMNQMMGAASTAMSDFLSRMVNISTPEAFEIKNLNDFITEYFPAGGTMLVVRFKLNIEDTVESEFMSAVTADLARELLAGFNISGPDVGLKEGETAAPAPAPKPTPASAPAPAAASAAQNSASATASGGSGEALSQDAIEKLLAGGGGAVPAPAAAMPGSAGSAMSPQMPQDSAMGGNMMAQMPQDPAAAGMMPQDPAAAGTMPQDPAAAGMMPQDPAAAGMMPQMPYPPYGMQMPYPPMYYPEPKKIQATNPAMPTLEKRAVELSEEQEANLDLLMSVPVDIAVEIGRTRRRVKDILNYSKGSLVVLDRLAGDRADLYVNGKCIAKGDIVVVDDNFGIRIAEIIEPLELEDLK